MTTIRLYYQIESGPLNGTVIEPIKGLIGVRYPHRKTKDLYIPPIQDDKRGLTVPWHCCQENCKEPDFLGNIESLVEHAMIHAGRALKKVKQGKD